MSPDPAPPDAESALVARRERLLGPAYRLFYEEPVRFVRGRGVWLYDASGAAYLDVYNNVPVVGHCHPRVVDAVTRQSATLNTHTRYLHDAILDYAEDLLATLPAPLGQVMFTCTGSEANDLALRIAKAHTGGNGVIVTANAYHGVTDAVAALSPSLGPAVAPGPHVFTVKAPDRRGDGDVGERLAAEVEAAIGRMTDRGLRPAAMIVDTIFSSDGVFAEPAGFLALAADRVRAAGGLFIADEVQAGFGRLGDGLWGFSRHGVVPDLVTMGKPMGNGQPIGGVAVRPELLQAFGRTSRYFNTFGGNPVSIAAAQAVLDTIADEDLVGNAARTGRCLRDALAARAARHPQLGEVRGRGLYVGVDVASPALAARIVNGLRRRRVLIGASGPEGDVLKIRPPLPFGIGEADLFLATFDEVVATLDEEPIRP